MLCTGGNEAPAGGREPKEKAPPLLAEAKVNPLPGKPAAPPKPPKPLLKPPLLLLPPDGRSKQSSVRTQFAFQSVNNSSIGLQCSRMSTTATE